MSRKTATGLISSRGGNKLVITEESSDGVSVRHCSRHRCSASIHSMSETQNQRPGKSKRTRFSSQSRGYSKLSSTTDCQKPCQEEKPQDLHTTGTHVEETSNPEASDRQGLDLSAINVELDSHDGCRLKENEKSDMTPESGELRRQQRFSEDKANGHRTGRNSTSSSRSSSKQVIGRDHQESKLSIKCNSTSETPRQPAMATSQDTEAAGVPRNGLGKFRHSAKLFLNRTVNTIGKRLPSRGILSTTGKRTTESVSRTNAGSSNGRSSSSTSSRNQYSRTSSLPLPTRSASERDVKSTTEDSTSPSNHVVATAQLTLDDELSSLPIIPTGWSCEDSSPCSGTNRQPTDFERLESQLPSPPLPQMAKYPTRDQEVLSESKSESETDEEYEYEDSSELDRLEQYEDYEQYFEEFGGYSDGWYYDQYRDMRMDIDDMSYEELLALGERIGTVSTAPSEEVVSECLKRCYYSTECLVSGDNDHEEDDIKCSICQEEYSIGEDLGKLPCQHSYHLVCIQQWLQLKNWCPICKTTMSPTS